MTKAKSWNLAKTALVVVVYHVLGFIMFVATPNQALFNFLSSILLCVAVAVIVAFAPGVWASATSGFKEKGDLLIMGVWLSWSSIIFQRIYFFAFETMGRPDWLLNSDLRSYPLLLLIISGVLHLIAPSVIDRRVPTRKWLNVGAVAGCGMALFLFAAWFF